MTVGSGETARGEEAPVEPGAATEQFPEIRKEAAKAAKAAEDAEVAKSSPSDEGPIPAAKLTQAYKEEYKDQFDRNLGANRNLRYVAFCLFGLLSIAYLVVLLKVLATVFLTTQHSMVVDALNWHGMVLIGVMFVVFAAVPLSLAMALVRMISDKRDESDQLLVKSPHIELAKVLVGIFKR